MPPPLRPDGSFRHPLYEQTSTTAPPPQVDPNGSVRVYYRRDRPLTNMTNMSSIPTNMATTSTTVVDSGHGSLSNRRSTPGGLAGTATTTQSPFSTLGKSTGEQAAVDLLHDKWADLMDRYLDNKFRSASAGTAAAAAHHNSTSTMNTPHSFVTFSQENANANNADQLNQSTISSQSQKRSHMIRLNDPNATLNNTSTIKRSRCQSPQDAFSYLYSGRDDLGMRDGASATSGSNNPRQSTSPYTTTSQQINYYNYNRGSPVTQSQRFPSPHLSVTSPSRSSTLNKQPKPQQQQQQQQPTDDTSKILHICLLNYYGLNEILRWEVDLYLPKS